MKIKSRIPGKVLCMLAMTLVPASMIWADPVTPLTEGDVITVTGTADPATPDAATNCSGTSPTISCDSLREAIIYANTNGNGATEYDVIQLANGATYTLATAGAGEDAAATGDLDILEAVHIEGVLGANATIDANGIDRAFDIFSGASAVEMININVINGVATSENGGAIRAEVDEGDPSVALAVENCTFDSNTALWDETVSGKETSGNGGAIMTAGALTITTCTFSNNDAQNYYQDDVNTDGPDGIPESGDEKAGSGGAINASFTTEIVNSTFDSNIAIDGGAVNQTGAQSLAITGSTLSNNQAVGGGAINNPTGAAITITNSTLSGNSVVDAGAGINSRSPNITLNFVTIAYNQTTGSGNKGVGLNLFGGGVANIGSSIFAENRGSGGALQNCGFTGGGGTALPCPDAQCESEGFNVSDDDSCDLDAVSDQVSVDVMLEPLANNGGPTETHALVSIYNGDTADSPAVDNHDAVSSNCAAVGVDQRGYIRPRDGDGDLTATCDAGAFELLVPTSDLQIASMTATTPVDKGDDVDISVVVQNGVSGGASADNVTITMGPLPASFTSATAIPSAGSCGAISTVTTWTCNFGTLAASATATLDINATASEQGSYTVSALNITSSIADANGSNNSASRTIVVTGVSDVALTATATNSSVTKGDNLEVTFNVTTNGPDPAYNVVLTSSTPATTTFVSATPSQGSCSEAAGTIRCELGGPLASSDPGYSVAMIFDTTASGTVTVAARADADDNDVDDTNNEASVDIEVKKKSSGGLCSYDPNAVFDPVLPAIVLLGLAYLGLRRRMRN